MWFYLSTKPQISQHSITAQYFSVIKMLYKNITKDGGNMKLHSLMEKCLETANVKSNYYLQDQSISIFEYKGDTKNGTFLCF